MSRLTKFKSPVPAGMRIFEYGVELDGVGKRSSHAKKFVKRSLRRIYLQRDPDNKPDATAVRVMGKSKGWFFTAEKCIGFVPPGIARKLVNAGLADKVTVRLQLISTEDRNSVHIRFDMLGRMSDYENYSTR